MECRIQAMLNIVLFEPEIPQNTGNIARTCACTGAHLHLVHPLGFDISEKRVRHAGLDYWSEVAITEYKSIDEFFSIHESDELWFFSSHGKTLYSSVKYNDDTYLVFGKESTGLGNEILSKYQRKSLYIPQKESTRSLNLSNSVAIAAYSVLERWNFPGLGGKNNE